MPTSALRSKRNVAAVPQSQVVTESEFHQTRMQEQLRTTAIKDFGATEQQVAPSYFTASLQELAAQRLADSFAENPQVDALREEQPALYAMVLERLPTQPETMLPLRITVPRIVDEKYWQRCCLARWPLGQLSRITKGGRLEKKEYGWKRLFLEQVLSDFLMALGSGNATTMGDGSLLPPGGAAAGFLASLAGPTLSPPHGRQTVAQAAAAVTCTPFDADASRFHLGQDDDAVAALRELCAICRDFVHTVDLPCQLVHFRFYEHLFAHVPGILSFRVSFGVANRGVHVGVSDMIGFRDEDALQINQLLRHYSALESLRLPLNRLANRHVHMIAAGLVNSTTLRLLDLSQNSLTDAAVVDAVSLLLCRTDFPLEELYLGDNTLGDAAAAALAEALHFNKTLRVLHLEQNNIGDVAGGAVLVRALAVHPTLADVHLGYNGLGAATVSALAEVLPQLTKLRVLSLAGNTQLAGPKVPQLPLPGTSGAPTGATAALASSMSASRVAAGTTQQPGSSAASLPSGASMTLSAASVSASSTVSGAAADGIGASMSTSPVGEAGASATAAPGAGQSGEEEPGKDGDGDEAVAEDDMATAATAEGDAYRDAATARPSMATVAGEDIAAAPRAPSRVAQRSKGVTHHVATAAPPPPPEAMTTGGVLLAQAVNANTSLVELDVLHCGMMPGEEQAMMRVVQERVYQHQMDVAASTTEAEQRRALQRRAEDRVARMTGRTF